MIGHAKTPQQTRTESLPTIAIALRLSFASHRDILSGILREARTHPVRLKFIATPDSHAQDRLDVRADDSFDGLITCEDYDDLVRSCPSAAGRPAVTICPHRRATHAHTAPIASVKIDGRALGRTAADYFLSLGRFRAFGFVGESHRPLEDDPRAQGFAERLYEKAHSVLRFPHQESQDGSSASLAALADWLAALPKPAAVMASYDLLATQVLDAAHEAGLDVPNQVAVLGVDNDNLLCGFTAPPLTSLAPNFAQAGAQAVRTLLRLMGPGRTARIPTALIRGHRLVERESTRHLSPSAALVERAQAFIRQNACDGIDARDVVTHLGVSRRLADRRFRELTRKSILEAILETRLNALKDKLAATRRPIGTLTLECGFRSENHAKALFRKRFGLSMRAFRNAQRSDRECPP